VVPVLDTPVISGTNLIWCASFQLAWNKTTEFLDEDLHFKTNEPACVSKLNRHTVTATDLDSKTVLAVAGLYTPEFIQQLNRKLKKQFSSDSFSAESPPGKLSDPMLAAFGYLSVNLPCLIDLSSPLQF
jgi:hypothetical protein